MKSWLWGVLVVILTVVIFGTAARDYNNVSVPETERVAEIENEPATSIAPDSDEPRDIRSETGVVMSEPDTAVMMRSEDESLETMLATVVPVSGGTISVPPSPRSFTETPTIPSEMFLVRRVIDGDTIIVATVGGERRVRYISVDTPETVHPSKPIECMGREASDYNKQLVEGKWVRLERDISDTDKYGRWLRYVYVDDVFVNAELIRQGYANVVTYPPDVKYVDVFRALEREAREGMRGLWSGVCEGWVGAPQAPRPVVSQTPSSSQCLIKGNINSGGDKIYHLPGCKSYDQTIITEETGEQWFCTEAEAVNAGWRKAGNC